MLLMLHVFHVFVFVISHNKSYPCVGGFYYTAFCVLWVCVLRKLAIFVAPLLRDEVGGLYCRFCVLRKLAVL